ncbi:MAG: HYR domain-containing protein, partial [Bacteroidales bacterium]|nr:HYR domain-containing protein [Bacteroidales bacterium]
EADNCTASPVVAFVSDVSDGNTCPELITRTYSVTDDCGNQILVTQTITVDDDTPPDLTCPSDITQECGDKDPVIKIPVATDNCDEDVKVTWTRSDGLSSAALDDINSTFEVGETTITFIANDDCGNKSTCTILVTVIPCDASYCTYTQGFYGNEGGLTCDGMTAQDLMENAFDMWTDDFVEFGDADNDKVFTLTLDDILNGNIFKMLPGEGPSAALKGDATYSDSNTWLYVPISNKGTIKNNLLAQTMTLWFSLANDPALGNLEIDDRYIITAESETCGSEIPVIGTEWYTEIPQSIFEYFGEEEFTVNELLELANQALGDVISKDDISFADITEALDAINNAFDECRILMSFEEAEPLDIPRTGSDLEEDLSFVTQLPLYGTPVMDIDYKVYPNPFKHKVFFDIKANENTSLKLVIITSTGQLVEVLYDGEVLDGTEYKFVFDSKSYTDAMFLFRIITDHSDSTGQLIKAR